MNCIFCHLSWISAEGEQWETNEESYIIWLQYQIDDLGLEFNSRMQDWKAAFCFVMHVTLFLCKLVLHAYLYLASLSFP